MSSRVTVSCWSLADQATTAASGTAQTRSEKVIIFTMYASVLKSMLSGGCLSSWRPAMQDLAVAWPIWGAT
jgi:hypothetical protein